MRYWQGIEIFDAIDGTVAVTLLILYCRAFARGFQITEVSAVDILLSGICLTWFATAVDRFWRLAFHAFHRPGSMQDSPVIVITLFAVSVGGALHIFAKNDRDNRGLSRSWAMITLAVAIGLIIGLAAVWWTGNENSPYWGAPHLVN